MVKKQANGNTVIEEELWSTVIYKTSYLITDAFDNKDMIILDRFNNYIRLKDVYQ
jgi:hypothetical protein